MAKLNDFVPEADLATSKQDTLLKRPFLPNRFRPILPNRFYTYPVRFGSAITELSKKVNFIKPTSEIKVLLLLI